MRGAIPLFLDALLTEDWVTACEIGVPMRILIIGAGAVGGYFGAQLAAAGRDVTFLVRGARARDLATQGLRIRSPRGDTVITPRLVRAGEIREPYDLLLVSVKAYALLDAMQDFAAAVGPQTIILPVLNGMRHLDTLTQRFGTPPVMGGVCRVIAELDNAGRIVKMTDLQQLQYGELSGAVTPRLKLLDATLQCEGIEARQSTEIIQVMWEKWVQLASIGAATGLLRGTIGDIAAVPGGAAVTLGLLQESATVASACGHAPSTAFLAQQTAALTAQGSTLASSMYRDLLRNAPVEVDHILGDLLERGRAHKVVTTLLQAAFVNLRIYQARVSGPRAVPGQLPRDTNEAIDHGAS
jgi:2-dehydropantoate 2-reductase